MDDRQMDRFRRAFMKTYLDDVRRCLDEIEVAHFWQNLSDVEEVILNARERGNTIFVMGNGGSASTASHFAADLSKGAAAEARSRTKAVALTDNVPQLTAWANDQSYDDIFVEQLKNLLEEADVAIGFSCSGNSMNVIKAMDYANRKGASTIGFTGFDGGELRNVTNICVVVPCQNMQRCEDIHLLLGHLLSSMIRAEALLGERTRTETMVEKMVETR